MDTKLPVILVLSLAVAAAMWGGSGIAADLTTNPAGDLQSDGNFEEEANDSSISDDGEFEGPVASNEEGNIVGLIISGGRSIAGVFALAVLLPGELIALGIPAWAALPLGLLAQMIVGIGIIQFVTGRVFR